MSVPHEGQVGGPVRVLEQLPLELVDQGDGPLHLAEPLFPLFAFLSPCLRVHGCRDRGPPARARSVTLSSSPLAGPAAALRRSARKYHCWRRDPSTFWA